MKDYIQRIKFTLEDYIDFANAYGPHANVRMCYDPECNSIRISYDLRKNETTASIVLRFDPKTRELYLPGIIEEKTSNLDVILSAIAKRITGH